MEREFPPDDQSVSPTWWDPLEAIAAIAAIAAGAVSELKEVRRGRLRLV